MQQAFIYNELREWETAISVLEPVRSAWQETGMSPHDFMMRVVLGRCLAQTGKIKEGLAEIRAALTWAESVDYKVFTYMGNLNLAYVLHLQDDKDAYKTAQKSVALSNEVGDVWASAVAYRTLAVIDMHNPHETDWQLAEQNLLTAMDMLRKIRARADLAHTYLMLRRLYDRAGQVAWAIDCHFRALNIFEELGMESELKIARGQAGQGKQSAIVIPGLKLTGPTPSEF